MQSDSRTPRIEKLASRRQQIYFRHLTGLQLPPITSRARADDYISSILAALTAIEKKEGALSDERRMAIAQKVLAHFQEMRKKPIISTRTCRLGRDKSAASLKEKSSITEAVDIVRDRLAVLELGQCQPHHLDGVTLLVNIGDAPHLKLQGEGTMNVSWSGAENVDEKMLEGLIRLVSSTMKGVDQKVLVTGTLDSITVVAACVLREYLGVDPTTATRILQGRRLFLAAEALQVTIAGYQKT